MRDVQVIELLLQGMENDEIARTLRISESNVKHVLGGLYKRYNIHAIAGAQKRVKLAVLMGRKPNYCEWY